MPTGQSLSPGDARKLILQSQGIHREADLGRGNDAVLGAIKKLGYVQIDTISVIERAHHHTLWNRVKNYSHHHLDQLVEDKQIFEYWSHAAAYLPMCDFRFSLPRKQAIAGGEKHWYSQDKKTMKQVLDRIKIDGPMQSRDFDQTRIERAGWTDWKPAKRALEQLFMEGELMIVKRRGFQKVYDLTERVLPASIDTSSPSTEEFFDHLICNYLQSNGIGTPSEIAYLRKGIKADISARCAELLEDGVLEQYELKGQCYYLLKGQTDLLAAPMTRSKVKILSPFDNLLIQRKRMTEIFDFDYIIECYVPAAKRKYGYFCLPLLWGQTFAGRMDAKIDRKTGILDIFQLHVETNKSDQFLDALRSALSEFIQFNGGKDFQIHRIHHLNQSLLN